MLARRSRHDQGSGQAGSGLRWLTGLGRDDEYRHDRGKLMVKSEDMAVANTLFLSVKREDPLILVKVG